MNKGVRTYWVAFAAAATSIAVGACQRTPSVEAASGRAEIDLAAEFEAIRTLLLGRGLLTVLGTIAIGALAMWLIGRGAARLRVRGWDNRGWVSRGATLGYVLTALVLADTIVVKFHKIAPVLTSALLIVTAIVVAISSIGLLQNLYAGASIALRGGLKKGTHMDIGERRGVVVWIGPLATGLQTPDGSIVHVPNRVFEREPFSTRSPDKTAQVTVRLPQAQPVTEAFRERARRLALLCPYRQPTSGVSITVEGDDRLMVVVAFQVPSDSLRDRAERFVLDNLCSTLPVSSRNSQSVWLARS